MDVSVIIVTYNEEKNIGRCLDSVFKLFESSNYSFEVVLVDSRSTDRTLEISNSYKLKTVVLEDFISPSTAKNVGFLISQGRVILFLDGDMELVLNQDDLKQVMNLFGEGMGGIQGYLEDYVEEKKILTLRKVSTKTPAEYLPGSAFYSRDALELENFNPNINSNEERDLGFRLNDRGISLILLPIPLVKHYRRSNQGTYKEIKRRYRNSYYLGTGQVLRANINNFSLLFKHVLDQIIPLCFSLFIILLIISIPLNLNLAFALILLHLLSLMFYLVRYKSVLRYLDKYFFLWGLVCGFITYRNIDVKYKII